jgi:hypothetical protein
MTAKEYLIAGGILVAGWLLISRPMSRAEAARSEGLRFVKGLISLAVAGACVRFAWWVLSTRCGGSC